MGNSAAEPSEAVTSPAPLPRPLNSLIGRDLAVRQLTGTLVPASAVPAAGGGATDAARLVTLTGAAGCGKTRLAIAVAHQLATDTSVSFVDLSTVDIQHPDPSDVDGARTAAEALAGAVLGALGRTRVPGRDTLSLLVEALPQPGHVLLLDNCEHVAAGCARMVTSLLAAHGAVRVLATSRQPLRVRHEVVHRVDPLPVSGGADSPAVALFRARMFERTGAAMPAKYLPSAEAICRDLDGLPLAIELAAARGALLSVPEVHRLLADRFRVLADAKADGPNHHRTLRATMDWSYDLLDDGERTLLRRLAVFRGGWSAEAAGALPGCTPDRLRSLVAKSLVVEDVHTGVSRYRMLQTVAVYAAGHLAEHPHEAAEAAAAHAAHFLDLAERAAPELRGPRQRDWLRRLTADQENLRVAMSWLARRPQHAGDLRLAAALVTFGHLTGQYAQGRRWLAEALTRRPDAPAALRASAHSAAAGLALLECDYADAAELAGHGLALSRTLPERPEYGRLLTLLGSVERERGRYPQSLSYLSEAGDFYRDRNDLWGAGRATLIAGGAAWLAGWLRPAQALLGDSLIALRHVADAESIATAGTHLGAVAHFRGDEEAARSHLDEALASFTELNFPEGLAWALELLARVELRRPPATVDLGVADRHLHRSLALHRRVGDRWRTASVLEVLAARYALGDEPARAAALLGAADRIRGEIGAPTPACERPDRIRTAALVRAALGASGYARMYLHGGRVWLDRLLDTEIRLPDEARAAAARP